VADTYKYFGTPKETYGYDPDKARALLKEAATDPRQDADAQGPAARPRRSGNMVPLPMAEFVQQSYKEIGIEVEYVVVDWGTMLTTSPAPRSTRRAASGRGQSRPADLGPDQFFLNFHGASFPPNGSNWSLYRIHGRRAAQQGVRDLRCGRADPLIAEAHALWSTTRPGCSWSTT